MVDSFFLNHNAMKLIPDVFNVAGKCLDSFRNPSTLELLVPSLRALVIDVPFFKVMMPPEAITTWSFNTFSWSTLPLVPLAFEVDMKTK